MICQGPILSCVLSSFFDNFVSKYTLVHVYVIRYIWERTLQIGLLNLHLFQIIFFMGISLYTLIDV